jgi:hypothetical protein
MAAQRKTRKRATLAMAGIKVVRRSLGKNCCEVKRTQVGTLRFLYKVALYDFLSTFSGKHFVTPRTYTAALGFHF